MCFLIIILQLFEEQDANLRRSDVKHANAIAFLLLELFEPGPITQETASGWKCANIMGRMERVGVGEGGGMVVFCGVFSSRHKANGAFPLIVTSSDSAVWEGEVESPIS